MEKILSILALITILIIACEPENPTITENGYGKVLVKSNVEKGKIFVEGEFTGNYTPDTLELLGVKHKIKVSKEGYFSEEREISLTKNELIEEMFHLTKNKLIKNTLIEYFSSDATVPKELEELVQNNNQLLLIQYPSISEDIENSFTYTDRVNQKERENYFGLKNNPFTAVNGSTTENYNEIIQYQLLKETKLEIVLQDTLGQGGTIIINANVDVYDLHGLDFNNLVLRVAIVENNVSIENELNISTEEIFNSVFRSFVPDHDGISLKGISKRGRSRFAVDIFPHPRWKKENLSCIGFVQNENTKEILQVSFEN